MEDEQVIDVLKRIDVESIVELFKALTEPRRIIILQELLKGERCICDFVKILGLSQPAVSYNIAILSRVGLINTRKEGRKVFCSIRNKEILSLFFSYAERLLAS